MKNNIKSVIIAFASVALVISSCKKDNQENIDQQSTSALPDVSERNTNPDETIIKNEAQRNSFTSYLYTESNEMGTNHIHIYKQHPDGHLSHEGMVASGGAGNAMGLGSQGALCVNANNKLLFAVNAGDNSVSSFRIHTNGSLTLLDTKPSGGTTPVSLCIRNRHLYIVHSGSSSINGFSVDAMGTLLEIPGSNHPLSSSNAGPAQIAFSPNGHYIYVTEKMNNKITSFVLDANGVASPYISVSSTGTTPFGFSIARNKYMIVTNANGGTPQGSSCTSYSALNSGSVNPVNGNIANNQTAACWAATTVFGTFTYVSNTGSNTISTYYTAPAGNLYLVHANTVATGNSPADICVAPNNYYIYNINSMSHSISGFHRTFLGDLIPDGTTSGLPAFASGLVAI
ncbi:MAG: beta-propeller fold lactonase family protein [Bacteroidota bacterium]